MKLSVEMNQVQHIANLNVSFDLSEHLVACIVGRNGCGKTTLIKGLRNLLNATTFSETSPPNIFNSNSFISYSFNDQYYTYNYNENLHVLDSKDNFNQAKLLIVELPVPYGERFKYYQKLGALDETLRASITEKSYTGANDLIQIYESLYNLGKSPHRFSNLKKITIKGEIYYFIRLASDFYVRQDYFSSGEYFVLELFRLISKPNCLVVIDELDISLDAAAQVKLLDLLRPVLKNNNSRLLFTTHSLALMKSLQEGEIHFMENQKGNVELTPRSYNYVKSSLFGFTGSDRVILVEDIMTKDYLKWLLKKEIYSVICNIIYIGGHQSVVDLYNRAIKENYFNLTPRALLCCLDGDQENETRYQKPHILFLPVPSVEKRLCELHDTGSLSFMLANESNFTNKSTRAKKITEQIIKPIHPQPPIMNKEDVFSCLLPLDDSKMMAFKARLENFLKYPAWRENII